MESRRKYIIVSIFIFISVIVTTYAYFSTNILNDVINRTGVTTGSINMSISDNEVNVIGHYPIYDETYSTLAYSKSFTVTNHNDSLNICSSLYLSVDSIDKELRTKDFKWKLISSDGKQYDGDFSNIKDSKILLLNNIFYNSGDSKVYTLYIWVSYNDSYDQMSLLDKSLSSRLYIEGTSVKERNVCENVTLYNAILYDNKAISDEEVNFNTFDGNGLYYTVNLNNNFDIDFDGKGEKIYYFRGNVNNNYVMFSDMCFRILRTNEDGSVRLYYYGKSCNKESIGKSEYNTLANDNSYVGYMNGGVSNSISESVSNKYDSTVKTYIDNWYKDNIDSDLVVDSYYCNDRSIYSGSNYSNNKTIYNGFNRFKYGIPKYLCSSNDIYTLKAGLITIDEIMYAGLYKYSESGYETNTENYLYTDNLIHTMSPYGYFDNAKMLPNNNVNDLYDIYPVISLKKDVIISKGDGSFSNPYVIK